MLLRNEEEEGMDVDMENGNGGSRNPKRYWSVRDDSLLIRGWLNFPKTEWRHRWDKIAAVVNDNNPIKDNVRRNNKSCKNRWNLISKFVAKYVNAMARARERATPKMSESDVLIVANQLYRDDVKSDFTLSHAYELLHTEPKFLDTYIITKKQDDQLSSGAEASSKRSRLNEGGNYLSVSSTDADNGEDADPSTPQVPTRSMDVKGRDEREMQPMQSFESLGEHVRGSVKVFRETNQKVDEWKEVKLREMQIEEKRMELEVKKMEQKNRDNRYKLFNTLLRKDSLSQFDEALKNKLYAELFPE